MDEYNLFIKKSAIKELERLPKKDLQRVIDRIHALGKNPRPQNSEKLAAQDLYRVRQGHYGIIYWVNDKQKKVEIIKIGHRREIYE
jgi:mRNA interferase RelE/StbE